MNFCYIYFYCAYICSNIFILPIHSSSSSPAIFLMTLILKTSPRRLVLGKTSSINSPYVIVPFKFLSNLAPSQTNSDSVGWNPFLYINRLKSSMVRWPYLNVSTQANASCILNEGLRTHFFLATSTY